MRRKYDHDKILLLVDRGLADWRIAEIMKMQKDRVGIIRRRYNKRHNIRKTISINIPESIWKCFSFDRNYNNTIKHIIEVLHNACHSIGAKSPDST